MFYSKGGKPINSGGYGCVFKPALNCKGQTKRNEGISKLMTGEHAESEYQIIMRFADLIRKIPNYQRYFVLDGITLCKPNKLTKEDLIEYSSVCGSLTRKNFTAKNVNSRLDELGILNLPDAGIDLDKYITSNQITDKLLENINRNIVLLLKNAIEPMNKLGILHMDMKGSNIMVDVEDNSFKIIDWGLADIYDGENVPLVATGRPIQYNTPFSSILFSDTFQTVYSEFIANTPDALSDLPEKQNVLDTFIINYYFYWASSRGLGHHEYIYTIIRYVASSNLNHYIPDDEFNNVVSYYFFYYLVSYISPILRKYTKDGDFNHDLYFREVYSKNVDVWGVIMSYEILLPAIHGNNSELTESQKKDTYAFVVSLLTNFLYSDSTKPIDITSLTLYISDFTKQLTRMTTTALSSKTSKTTRSRTTKAVSPDINIKSVIIDKVTESKPKTSIKVVKHTTRRKRCPNGTHWNKKENKCDPRYKKYGTKKAIQKAFHSSTQKTPIQLLISERGKRKRCPPGTRMNKKTGHCEPKTIMEARVKTTQKRKLKKDNLLAGIREILQN